MKRRAAIAIVAVVTLVTAWLSTRLRLDTDLTALFPADSRSAALAEYARAFGGGDVSLLLVRGDHASDVERATRDAARALANAGGAERRESVIADVIERAPLPEPPDPTLAWAYAGPRARDALAHAVTPEGMRDRLRDTRALLLAPGSEGAETWLARDPLRLAAIPFAEGLDLAAGVRPNAEGAFVADDGHARLVVIVPRGNAFDSDAAARFVDEVDSRLAPVKAAYPSVRFDATGGHAIARATEAMIRRDLETSGAASLVLATIAFVAFFRRPRALVAVLPPLLLGTLWTVGLAALVIGHLSAIGVAFMAVVVGVGVDTGVHVYAAFLDARARGLSGEDAADSARKTAARPTLLAATIAACAFAALALSSLNALRELGLLCAAGELATAVAILVVTPEIARFTEKSSVSWRATKSMVAAATATRRRSFAILGAAICACVAAIVLAEPRAGSVLVAIHPRGLAPLDVYEEIHARFGGRASQWIVLTRDANDDRARARADAIAESLDDLAASGDISGFDAEGTFAPSAMTTSARLATRDTLDLPGRANDLENALAQAGFDVAACAPAIDAFRHPRGAEEARVGAPSWLLARHEAHVGSDTLIATFVRPTEDAARDARALEIIHASDADSVITGYPFLEAALRADLTRDLPRVLAASLAAVVLGLFATLRRGRAAAIALFALVCETAIVLLFARAFGVTWHVYDALVVPVLLGITLDEVLFVLHAESAAKTGDAIGAALAQQSRLVATTAMTSAAGFAALAFCRFDGLRDLGIVGAVGSIAGLVCALAVVPAALRLTARTRPPS